MRLPKKVFITGRMWNIKRSSVSSGAEFNSNEAEITIGKCGKDQDFEMLLHEVLEAIIQDRGHRYHLYCDGQNEKLMFIMNHAQFNNVVQDLTAALRPIFERKEK
jgi:hypothetical protein